MKGFLSQYSGNQVWWVYFSIYTISSPNSFSFHYNLFIEGLSPLCLLCLFFLCKASALPRNHTLASEVSRSQASVVRDSWCLPSSSTCLVTRKLSCRSRLKALSGVSLAPLFTVMIAWYTAEGIWCLFWWASSHDCFVPGLCTCCPGGDLIWRQPCKLVGWCKGSDFAVSRSPGLSVLEFQNWKGYRVGTHLLPNPEHMGACSCPGR